MAAVYEEGASIMAKSSKKQPSVLTWMGSLFLYSIPGVNLIFLILSAILAKSASKRTFAIAGILLMVVFAVLIFAAFASFPDFFTKLTTAMRDAVYRAPVGDVIPPV